MTGSIFQELVNIQIDGRQLIHLKASDMFNGGILSKETQQLIRQRLADLSCSDGHFIPASDYLPSQEITTELNQQPTPQLAPTAKRASCKNIVLRHSVTYLITKLEQKITSYKTFLEAVDKTKTQHLELKKSLGIVSDFVFKAQQGGAEAAQTQGEKADEVYIDIFNDPFQKHIHGQIVDQALEKQASGIKQASEVQFDEINSSTPPFSLGSLVPLKQVTSFEQILVDLLNRLFSKNQVEGQRPKVLVVANQNIRSGQITSMLEQAFNTQGTLNLFKPAAAGKKGKIAKGQPEEWAAQLKQNDVFVFLSKSFLELLQHGDIDISQIDYLIFDQISDAQEQHAYNQIMNEHYYQLREGHLLPKLPHILGLYCCDNIFRDPHEKSKSYERLRMYANMFHSKSYLLSESQANDIYRAYAMDFRTSFRFNPMKPIQHMEIERDYKELMQFTQKMQNYAVRGASATQVLPCDRVIIKKQLGLFQTIRSGSAFITLNDSKALLDLFGRKVIEIANLKFGLMKNQVFKLNLDSSQYVRLDNRVRYFQTRIILDDVLSMFLPSSHKDSPRGWQFFSPEILPVKEIVDHVKKIHDESYLKKPVALKFKKKLESESQVCLDLLKVLFKEGFLNQSLLPFEYAIQKRIQQHYGIKITSQSELPGYQAQESLSQSSGNSTIPKSEAPFYNQPRPIQGAPINQQQQPLPQQSPQLPIVEKIIQWQRYLATFHQEQVQIYEKDSKTSYNGSIKNFNIKKLELIIDEIINPILAAVQEYEKKAKFVRHYKNRKITKKQLKDIFGKEEQVNEENFQKYGVRWVSLNQNMICDTAKKQFTKDNKELSKIITPLCKERFSLEIQNSQVYSKISEIQGQKVTENPNVSNMQSGNFITGTQIPEKNLINASINNYKSDNSTTLPNQPKQNSIFSVYRKYAKNLFMSKKSVKENGNLIRGDIKLSENVEFMKLVSRINGWVENIKMPAMMTQNLSYQYYSTFRMKNQQDDERIFNRKSLLVMLILSLTQSEPSNLEYQKMRDEMERMRFLGDQIVSTATVTALYMAHRGGITEREFDQKKIPILKTSNLEAKALQFGIKYLLLKEKYESTPAKASKVDKNTFERKHSDILLTFTGYLGLYISFSAAFIFLQDIGLFENLLPLDHKLPWTEILGKYSKQQKVLTLKNLSELYSEVLIYEDQAKMELFKKIISTKPEVEIAVKDAPQKMLQLETMAELSAYCDKYNQVQEYADSKLYVEDFQHKYDPDYDSPTNEDEIIENENNSDPEVMQEGEQDIFQKQNKILSGEQYSPLTSEAGDLSEQDNTSQFSQTNLSDHEISQRSYPTSQSLNSTKASSTFQSDHTSTIASQNNEEIKEQVQNPINHYVTLSLKKRGKLFKNDDGDGDSQLKQLEFESDYSDREEKRKIRRSKLVTYNNYIESHDSDYDDSDEEKKKANYQEYDQLKEKFKQRARHNLKSYKQGFIPTNESTLMQSFTHKSFSEKIANTLSDKIKISNATLNLVKNQSNHASSHYSQSSQASIETNRIQLTKTLMNSFNYQIYEYIGDSLLNFSLGKLFYYDTANEKEQWSIRFFLSQKLHDLKTWFTSNHWLAYLLCEHFYNYVLFGDQAKQRGEEIEKMRDQAKEVKEKLIKLYERIENEKDSMKKNEELTKILKDVPLIPLFYDETNNKFKKQIEEYQQIVFHQCFVLERLSKQKGQKGAQGKKESQPQQSPQKGQEQFSESQSEASTSFSLQNFSQSQEDPSLEQFQELQDYFVKIFSDIFEAFVGNLFIDSGNFDRTQRNIISLMNTAFQDSYPQMDQERTKVLNIWNSKRYAQPWQLSHSVQFIQSFGQSSQYSEENNGEILIKGYIGGKLEIRRIRYSKETKKKVQKFYCQIRLYLEDAIQTFERQWHKKMLQGEINKEPEKQDWLDFNHKFRRNYAPRQPQNEGRQTSIIYQASISLYNKIAKEDKKKLTYYQLDDMKRLIADSIEKESLKLGVSLDQVLLTMENERVKSTRIREFYQLCEIKQLKVFDMSLKKPIDWVDKLSQKTIHMMFQQMHTMGELLIKSDL